MNAVSPICLVDLAPALRWCRSADVAPLLHHDRLIEGWWRSLPLARVLDIAGPTWLAHALARLAAEHWGHLPLDEFFPTLSADSTDLADLAEPVRGAVLATAGGWDRLIGASPQEMGAWPLPGCTVSDVVSSVAWRALQPCCELPGGPAPSPALMIEAVRSIANWLPESAPEHVRSALAYLTCATGADTDTAPSRESAASEELPQSPATRAIRTLRALRAQREDENAETAEAPEAAPAPGRSPAAEPRSQFRSSLLGPGRTLRRPSFGPPKALRETAQARPEPPPLGQHPLVDLVEAMFRTWPELERTLAAERLFATDPVSVRVLSDQIRVEVGEIRAAQRKVEERLLQWLSSPEGGPITKHMRELSEHLGSATTIDHLINAHPDHPVEVPTLGTPLWRVIITLFTDRRMHNGWLIADDPNRLRWQTRELLGDAPSLTEAGIRLGRIGIRQQELRAWLLSTPGVSIREGHVVVDPAVPLEAPSGAGYPVHAGAAQDSPGSTTTNGLPIRRRPGPGEEPSAQAPVPRAEHTSTGPTAAGPVYGPLTPAPASAEPEPDAASSARCFRAPDGRWWHRIDITAEQLNGAPVAVPPGYATHLGLQPGRLLCLTAPGADLLVLVWRDQPAFDSLRPLLRRLSAQPGDRVFITVNGDRLDARRLPAADLSEHSPASRALHLIGYTAPASTEEALKILSRRVSRNGDESAADPQTLIELLTRRGDTDIVGELRAGLYAAH